MAAKADSMKAMSLRISMQTQSPWRTPSLERPPAIRAAREAISAWVRLRSPEMMPRKGWDVSLIVFLFCCGLPFAPHGEERVGVYHRAALCADPLARLRTMLRITGRTMRPGYRPHPSRRDLTVAPQDEGRKSSRIGKFRRALFDIGADGLELVGAAEQLLLLDRFGHQRRAGIDGQIVEHAFCGADRVGAFARDLAGGLEGGGERI